MEVCQLASSGVSQTMYGLMFAGLMLTGLGVVTVSPRHKRHGILAVILIASTLAPILLAQGVRAADGQTCVQQTSLSTGLPNEQIDSDQSQDDPEEEPEATSTVTAITVFAPYGQNCGDSPSADLAALNAATTDMGDIDWTTVDLDIGQSGQQTSVTTGQYTASVNGEGLVSITLVGSPEFLLPFTVMNDNGATSNTGYIDVFVNTTCD